MSRRTISVLISLVVFVAFAARASAQPSVPGFNVSIFAELPFPVLMDFSPNGELYVGHGDASGRIRRISTDGLTIVDFGPLIEDPDAVLVDVNGTYSGTPLSVLVGGGAFIYAIAPDETMTTLYSGSPTFRNVGEMSFDSLSRLLFVDLGQLATPQVAVSDGGAFPVNLFNLPLVPSHLAIATDDSIYTCGNYGTIKIHAPDGTPINESFVTNLGGVVILEFGPGGAWGTLLHFIDRSGILMTVDSSGNTTVLGSGFDPTSSDVVFGPDGAMYVSEQSSNRILRIQVDCNNNSIDDADDIDSGFSPDFNDNGIPDECEPDCNTNGLPDFIDIAFDISDDCNLNTIPDECELSDGTSFDCNGNSVLDECDIATLFSSDQNLNGIPDECECLGDISGNSLVNVTDLLLLLEAWGPNPGHVADINDDGNVNVTDLLILLASWGAACP